MKGRIRWIRRTAGGVLLLTSVLLSACATNTSEAVSDAGSAESELRSRVLAVGDAWSAAKASFDVDGVMALMSQDATVSMLAAAKSLEELPDEIRFQRAYGYEFTVGGCRVSVVGADLEEPSTLLCWLDYQHPIARLHDTEPSAFGFRLDVLQGEVVSATLSDSGEHHSSIWVPLTDWLDQAHPDFDYFDFSDAVVWEKLINGYLEIHGA